MTERFENLDNILHNWVKDKISKSLDDAFNRYEKQGEEKNRFFLESGSEKNNRAVSVGSRARSNQKHIGTPN